jgi:predicted DNA-binding protein
MMGLLRDTFMKGVESIRCNANMKKFIHNMKSMLQRIEPPCIRETIEAYTSSISILDKTYAKHVEELAKDLNEQSSRIEALTRILGLDSTTIIKTTTKLASRLSALLRPPMFIVPYSCLLWYEQGGRYADRVIETGKEKVCLDIQHLDKAAETVSRLVNEIRDLIEILTQKSAQFHTRLVQ